MATIYHYYSEIEEPGIYRRVDSRENKTVIYICEGPHDDPRTISEYKSDYQVDGDDRYGQTAYDQEGAPYVSYVKIDELVNISKYIKRKKK